MRGLALVLGVLAVLVLGACRHDDPPPQPIDTASLADYLHRVAGTSEVSRAGEVASWRLDRDTWERITVEPYRAIYDDYARAFDAAAPALAAQLAHAGVISARAHYAGDPLLTAGQARARWALPVAFGSQVAELDRVPIDAVFIRDRDHWHAITGIDRILAARVGALDPACATDLAQSGKPGRCTDVGWLIADSALRTDAERFRHACRLAASICVVNGSP